MGSQDREKTWNVLRTLPSDDLEQEQSKYNSRETLVNHVTLDKRLFQPYCHKKHPDNCPKILTGHRESSNICI